MPDLLGHCLVLVCVSLLFVEDLLDFFILRKKCLFQFGNSELLW